MNWWVLSAKKEETRLKRLNELIEFSAREQRHPGLVRTERSAKKNPKGRSE